MLGLSLVKHRKVSFNLLPPWILMTLLLFITAISFPIVAQCSLASTNASRSASEASTVVADVMYVSGPNSKTRGWEHAAKKVRARMMLTMTFIVASPKV
jgi:hypothetical protein